MKIKKCPKCGSDLIHVESSMSMQKSEILCTDCGFGFQENCTEFEIIKKWNKVKGGSAGKEIKIHNTI